MDGTQVERLAIGTEDGSVEICDARGLVRAVRGHCSLESPFEATLRTNRTIAANSIVRLQLHKDWVSQLDYQQGMRALISASHDGHIKLTAFEPPPSEALSHDDSSWRQPTELTAAQCRNVVSFYAHKKGVNRVVQANAGGKRLLASCGHERSASVWNCETLDFVRSLDGHRGMVVDLTFDRRRGPLIPPSTTRGVHR